MNPSQFLQIQSYASMKKQLVTTLDLYFADIRSMLQLPVKLIRKRVNPTDDEITLLNLDGGCNYASCTFILDVICGISVCLYFRLGKIGLESKNDRGERFKEILTLYYPWKYETLDKNFVVDTLWKFLRNPLVHSMGILPVSIDINKVYIHKSDLTMKQIQECEDQNRAGWLSSTFELKDSAFRVIIPSLYWGLHELLRNLFSDSIQMTQVETYLQSKTKVII